MNRFAVLFVYTLSLKHIYSTTSTEDIDKFFKSPVLPHKKTRPNERQLKNQMKDLMDLLLRPKAAKKPKAEVSIADKLNMLDNFEKEADKIQSTKFSDDDGKEVFNQTKRKLLQTLSDRKLDLSLCKPIRRATASNSQFHRTCQRNNASEVTLTRTQLDGDAPHRKGRFEDGGRPGLDPAIVRSEGHRADLQSSEQGWDPRQVESAADEVQLFGSQARPPNHQK